MNSPAVRSKAAVARCALSCLLAALTACSATTHEPELPPLDARWVGSLYLGSFGDSDCHLARIRDLVDSNQIEVIAYAARTTGDLGAGPQPTVLLAGSADALALAHQRIAGPGSPGGQWRSAIGQALCMPDKERLQMADPLLSVVLLPDLNGLEPVIAGMAAGGCPEFRSGKPPGAGPRTLLIAGGSRADLRLLTRAMHANGVPFSGFVYCELRPLWSAPF